MKWLLLCPALLCVLGCERPALESFRQRPAPIVVVLTVPEGVSRDIEREYAAAIRAKLATLTTVVPEGVKAPVGSAELRIKLYNRSRGGISPGAVGAATGMAVGTLSAMAGNRDAIFDGLFWGIFAGTQAAEAKRMEMARLGYEPPRIDAEVALKDALSEDPLLDFGISPGEVIEEMQPLRGSERHDEFAMREEEAKAFAFVIAKKLQSRLQWMPLSRPSWYGE